MAHFKIIDSRPVVSDTAQWHLYLYICSNRISAYLHCFKDDSRNIFRVLEEPLPVGENFLQSIEKIIYDNPYILDDFATDIIISTDKFIYAPAELVKDSDDEGQAYFTKIYQGIEPTELFCDTYDKISCLYSPANGLKSFLVRTLPGSRISCESMVLLKKFINYPGGGVRVYLHLTETGTYMFGFSGKQLLFSSKIRSSENQDILYYLLNAMQVYSLDTNSTEVFVSYQGERPKDLVNNLRKFVKYARYTQLSELYNPEILPLSLTIRIGHLE